MRKPTIFISLTVEFDTQVFFKCTFVFSERDYVICPSGFCWRQTAQKRPDSAPSPLPRTFLPLVLDLLALTSGFSTLLFYGELRIFFLGDCRSAEKTDGGVQGRSRRTKTKCTFAYADHHALDRTYHTTTLTTTCHLTFGCKMPASTPSPPQF